MGMYFYDIDEPGELSDDDPGYIICRCEKCNNINALMYDNCEIVTDEYIKIKNGVELVCDQCGEKADQIIPYRLEEATQPTPQYTPKCPICHSPNIHKIKLGTKVSRAAIFGIFALPMAGKEWHCDNCGSEF